MRAIEQHSRELDRAESGGTIDDMSIDEDAMRTAGEGCERALAAGLVRRDRRSRSSRGGLLQRTLLTGGWSSAPRRERPGRHLRLCGL